MKKQAMLTKVLALVMAGIMILGVIFGTITILMG